MARAVKRSKTKKRRIKETKKNLKAKYRELGSTRKDARSMAKANAPSQVEAEKQKLISDNRAKRAKKDTERAALAEAKKSKSPGLSGLPSTEEVKRKQV